VLKDIVVLEEANPPTSRLSLYALHQRGLREKIYEGTKRMLRVNRIHDWSYQYNSETIGHGWVQKLVDRHIWCHLSTEMSWQSNSTKNANKERGSLLEPVVWGQLVVPHKRSKWTPNSSWLDSCQSSMKGAARNKKSKASLPRSISNASVPKAIDAASDNMMH
jgi:hypothetical protein